MHNTSHKHPSVPTHLVIHESLPDSTIPLIQWMAGSKYTQYDNNNSDYSTLNFPT